jgi:mono/diheme cytochrome c family protein
MRSRHFAAMTLAGALGLSASMMAVAQNAAPAPGTVAPAPGAVAPAAEPPPVARPGGGLVVLEFRPAMDDLMTMLVQPRHIKLYYAGQAKNWTLAGFELNELRGALARIGRTIPTYRKISVDEAVAAIFAEKVKAVDAAIKAADPAQFTAAYGEMTAACNACHLSLEHPFLKITVPDAANYPDQDFRP